MQMIYTREHTKVKPTYKIVRGFVKGREVLGAGVGGYEFNIVIDVLEVRVWVGSAWILFSKHLLGCQFY